MAKKGSGTVYRVTEVIGTSTSSWEDAASTRAAWRRKSPCWWIAAMWLRSWTVWVHTSSTSMP